MKNEIQHRSVFISRDAGVIDQEQRTVQIVFSTESPINMGRGYEILGHSTGEVDLEFADSGRAPLLLDHDQTNQIGVVERAWIENGEGKAVVRFSRSDEANEIFQDVVDGIRSCISVGYTIDEQTPVSKDTYRVTRWSVLEISIVSIPADVKARVGRAEIVEVGTSNEAVTDGAVESNQQTEAQAVPQPHLETKMSTENTVDLTSAIESARAAAAEIMILGQRFDMNTEAAEFVRAGKSADDFRKVVLEKRETQQTVRPVSELDLPKSDKREYSVAKAVLAMRTGNWKNAGYEREVSEEIAQRSGKSTSGLYVPMELFTRASGDPMKVGSTAEGKELVATSRLGNIPPLYNRLAMVQAGAQVLTGLQGDVEFSKSGRASFAWLGEDDVITKSTPSTGILKMSPKTCRGLVKFSHKLLQQANPSIEALVRNDLEAGIAEALDYAAFHGAGGAAPTGLFNTAGVGSVVNGATGAALTYAKVNEFITKVLAGNLSGNTFVGNPQVAGKLNVTQKVSGTDSVMIMNGYDNLLGFNYISTNNIRSDLTKGAGSNLSALAFGDFSQAILAQWGVTEIAMSDSNEDDFARGLLAIRVITYADFMVRYPGAFAVSTDIVTA